MTECPGGLPQSQHGTRIRARARDEPARWGGETFVILLPMTGLQEATAAADRLRCAIAADNWPAVQHPSASLGTASQTPAEPADALLDPMDRALCKTKETGCNPVFAAAP